MAGHTSLINRSGYEYATVAYDATTGWQLWAAFYPGPKDLSAASSLAVSPDGTKVFVTGDSAGNTDNYATVAYDAASGTQLWLARYAGPGKSGKSAVSIAANPNGTKVTSPATPTPSAATMTT